MTRTTSISTHEVTNQSPPFRDVNLFTSDKAQLEAVEREGGKAGTKALTAFGAKTGSADACERGRLANEFPPRLKSFDEKGNRIDRVEFHPAYHECMAISMAEGLHCATNEHLLQGGKPKPGANVIRAAGSFMAVQMEPGHCCPVTMTNASVAALVTEPDLAGAWLPKILVRAYDSSFQPAAGKRAVTIGMGMTEKQGGTDVRANTTRAEPVSEHGSGAHRITGHKWFLSAPMCDAFLILAQAPKGLSCFLLPRFLPDGGLNAMRIQRLKDKLGNRANASCEVEFEGALAWRVGEEGRGVATIIEMVTLTRLDCAVSSAAMMRFGLANAIHHCKHRQVFGRKLAEQPMMASVLADLALESEAATALAFRLARTFDHPGDPREASWQRVMTPIIKYWVCKSTPGFSYEAMECLGGNGYVEDGTAARIYREAPVNAIWEGSGNVMGLDVLRVLMKEPDAAELVIEGLGQDVAGNKRLSAYLAGVREILHRPRELEANMRVFVEGLALATAGALLNAHAPHAVSDAFIASRLEGPFRRTYGAGLTRADTAGIIDRAAPVGL